MSTGRVKDHPSIATDPEALRRFWNRVDKTPGLGPYGDCWVFSGCGTRYYGRLLYRGMKLQAHVISYELEHGPVPLGLVVRHVVCDFRACVNPAHLLAGTHQDNMDDAVARGRMKHTPERKEKQRASRRTKLTAAEAEEIRWRYAAGGTTTIELAAQYRVSQPNISAIVLGQKWCHVGGPRTERRSKDVDDAAVAEIVRMCREGKLSQAAIGKQFGITQQRVSVLARRHG